MNFPLTKRNALSLRPPHPFCSGLELSGGGERDRTDDLLRAKQVLSQLSYTPKRDFGFDASLVFLSFRNLNSKIQNRRGGPSWS